MLYRKLSRRNVNTQASSTRTASAVRFFSEVNPNITVAADVFKITVIYVENGHGLMYVHFVDTKYQIRKKI